MAGLLSLFSLRVISKTSVSSLSTLSWSSNLFLTNLVSKISLSTPKSSTTKMKSSSLPCSVTRSSTQRKTYICATRSKPYPRWGSLSSQNIFPLKHMPFPSKSQRFMTHLIWGWAFGSITREWSEVRFGCIMCWYRSLIVCWFGSFTCRDMISDSAYIKWKGSRNTLYKSTQNR